MKASTDKTVKSTARDSRSDLAREVAAFRRYAAQKKKLRIESAEEKAARQREEDVRRLKREVTKGLQLADVEGLADHLKEQRLARASKAAVETLRDHLANSAPPATEEEALKREESLKDYFAALTTDSPSRTCISCRQLFYGYQTQHFMPRCLEEIRGQEAKVREKVASLRATVTEATKAKTEENIALLNTYYLASADIRIAYEEAKLGAMQHPRLFGHPDHPSVRVCKRCWKCLKTGMAPQLGYWNQLKAIDLPPALSSLNGLEAQLVSLRQPFMKIAALPRGGQKGVTGGVINVPADVQATMSRLLPLNLEEGKLIAVQLKKRLMFFFASYYFVQLVIV